MSETIIPNLPKKSYEIVLLSRKAEKLMDHESSLCLFRKISILKLQRKQNNDFS